MLVKSSKGKKEEINRMGEVLRWVKLTYMQKACRWAEPRLVYYPTLLGILVSKDSSISKV